MLLKGHILFGCFFVFFATNYSRIVVSILGGSKWVNSDAPIVLSYYCLYVPVMGLNGVFLNNRDI